MDTNIKEKAQWTNSIPIFKNATILKQLGIAVGLPFGLVIAFGYKSYQKDQQKNC